MAPRIEQEFDHMTRYEAIGYTDQYRLVNNQLENIQSKRRYAPKDVNLVKEHRYGNLNDPFDMLLLYVIKTNDGSQGMVLASYGDRDDCDIHKFMNVLPRKAA